MSITRTTSFPTNVILSDTLGTPASPTAYFGFANASGTQVASTGPRIQSGSGNPNGTLTSPLGSLWIDSATGTSYVNVDGATQWVVSSGNTSQQWSPLLTQSPLNAATDYFNNGAVLDSKWTLWNPGANTTATQSQASRLRLLQTTHAGNAVGGIRQAAPASTRYAITAKIGVTGIVNNVMDGGIFVAGDIAGAPTTAPFVTVDNTYNSATAGGALTCSLFNWTNYTTLAGATKDLVAGNAANLVRLFVDTVGTNYMLLLSPDGEAWQKIAVLSFAASAIGGPPLYIGQHVNNGNTGEDVSLYSAMFRVDATTDPYLQCGGFL